MIINPVISFIVLIAARCKVLLQQ